MSIKELSDYIKEYKNGQVPYPYGDDFIVSHHVRGVLRDHMHITEAHIMECCQNAASYDEFID